MDKVSEAGWAVRVAQIGLKAAEVALNSAKDALYLAELEAQGIKVGDTIEWVEPERNDWNGYFSNGKHIPAKVMRGMVVGFCEYGYPKLRLHKADGTVGIREFNFVQYQDPKRGVRVV